jgi:hypothetical protein
MQLEEISTFWRNMSIPSPGQGVSKIRSEIAACFVSKEEGSAESQSGSDKKKEKYSRPE